MHRQHGYASAKENKSAVLILVSVDVPCRASKASKLSAELCGKPCMVNKGKWHESNRPFAVSDSAGSHHERSKRAMPMLARV
jgi:hypothetical protein